MALHVIENGELRVTVADLGAELISVLDKATGRSASGRATRRSGIATPRSCFPLSAGSLAENTALAGGNTP